jgi:hypothetical protein
MMLLWHNNSGIMAALNTAMETTGPLMEKSRTKISAWLMSAMLLITSLIFSLAIAEVTMRVIGYSPHSPQDLTGDGNRSAMPLMTDKHPLLGWVNKPGTYVYPGFSPEVESISVTILPDGSRATHAGERAQASADKLIMVGDSYTMGYAISDNETFAWKVQAQFPELNVMNMGVPGYGSYQSLLTLEDLLPRVSSKKTIFYGYIGHHQFRNVLDPGWMSMFADSKNENRMPPYATTDAAGELVRHEISNRRSWPFRELFALVNWAERGWINYTGKDRFAQRSAVTEEIILEMQEVADTHDAQLIILLLNNRDANGPSFMEFLESNELDHLNCDQGLSGPEFSVAGEGHPNGKQNGLWAQCISDFLRANKS